MIHTEICTSISASDAGNIAVGKPAAISSTYSSATAHGAVDGDIGTAYIPSCSISSVYDVMPWWMVDLHGAYRIDSIRLIISSLFRKQAVV